MTTETCGSANRHPLRERILAALAVAAGLGLASPGAMAQNTPAQGSSAFCLFPLPADNGTQRWINLGIVQYVELRENTLVLAYGGGNLGSGHEIKIPVKTKDEAQEWLNRLRQTAQDCTRRPVIGELLK